jgi:uncharacterized glyoxalase superfamily protein PhnB
MPKVKPVPKGYHALTPGVVVEGAGEFIKFCKKVFGAKEVMRMPGPGGSVMHAELAIGDAKLMVGDTMPGAPPRSAKALRGTPVTFHVYVANCDAVYKKALGAGATAKSPVMDMFWGDRYGTVEDPFGNLWGIATHKEEVSPKEMKKRAAAMMRQGAAAG